MAPTSAVFVAVPCPASWLNGTGHFPSPSGYSMCMCAHEYIHAVGGWMGAFCSAFGAATQPQPLADTDPLVLVAIDNLLMQGSAVLL